MKKQIIVAVLVCGACFALCSCGKNKATTFTTDDIDTFVNSVNGNSSSTDSSDSDNYDGGSKNNKKQVLFYIFQKHLIFLLQ